MHRGRHAGRLGGPMASHAPRAGGLMRPRCPWDWEHHRPRGLVERGFVDQELAGSWTGASWVRGSWSGASWIRSSRVRGAGARGRGACGPGGLGSRTPDGLPCSAGTGASCSRTCWDSRLQMHASTPRARGLPVAAPAGADQPRAQASTPWARAFPAARAQGGRLCG